MKALTLWRPWDTAVLRLGKPLENREWPPPPSIVGHRIALHSGRKWDEEGACSVVRLAVGEGIAEDVIRRCLDRAERVHSAILGTVKIARVLRRDQAELGAPDPLRESPWFFGSFGWVCEQPIVFDEPIPCRGAQGLWTVPDEVMALMLAAMTRAQRTPTTPEGKAP